jgi:hypothetical protein
MAILCKRPDLNKSCMSMIGDTGCRIPYHTHLAMLGGVTANDFNYPERKVPGLSSEGQAMREESFSKRMSYTIKRWFTGRSLLGMVGQLER